MKHEAIYIDDTGTQWHFRVDGHSVRIYADCYASAIKKLKAIYGNDIIIKDSE